MRLIRNAITVSLCVGLLASVFCGCEHAAEPFAYPDELPGHITEIVEPGLEIDLEVEAPAVTSLTQYEAAVLQADEQTMTAFLDELSDCVKSTSVDAWLDGAHTYAVITEKGAYAGFQQYSDAAAASTEWSYYAPSADEYNYAVIDYYGSGRKTDSHDNTHLYLAAKDFAFADCDTALLAARGLLKLLGLTDLELTETLYLDHEIMSEYVKTPAAQDLLEHYGMQQLAQRGYDASYDAYSFRFSLGRDGIPLFEEAFWNTTVGYAAPNIVVRINQDGIFAVNVYECSPFGDAVGESRPVFPAGRVLSDVRAMLQDTICPYERKIDGLMLRYIYWRDADRLLLKPVWVVSVREAEAGAPTDVTSPDSPREDSCSFFIYDAQTGELLCTA